jgi:hypothetical protein
MAKYLLVYHGGSMADSEAEQAAAMEAWGKWFGTLGASVVDGGNPTGESVTITSDRNTTPGGGANPASGYSLIDADSIEDAAAKAKGCPIPDGGVEVCETIIVGP